MIFLHSVKLKILFVRKIGNSLSDKKGDNPFLYNIRMDCPLNYLFFYDDVCPNLFRS